MGILIYIVGVVVAYLLIGYIEYVTEDPAPLIVTLIICAMSWIGIISIVILFLLVWVVESLRKLKFIEKLSPINVVTWLINLFKKNDTPKQDKTKHIKRTTDPNAFDITKSHWEK